ncbi:MAG: hypothetical protein WD845_09335 [Pirellulales bacterium]
MLNCARCGREMATGAQGTPPTGNLAAAAESGIDLGNAGSASDFAAWELDQQVRRLQARVGTWRRFDPPREAAGQPAFVQADEPEPSQRAKRRRIDAPHSAVPRKAKRRVRRARTSSPLGWWLLALGLMTFSCGTALLVCSWIEHRQELWNLGVAIAIGGQVGLLSGLVLQLERIWQNGRLAVRKLNQVDAQLHAMQRATSNWNATHGTASQAFYTHMAEEASPDILLADLQGQLDMLSSEITRRR